jgi:eukaryotic translation initiation factor 2C
MSDIVTGRKAINVGSSTDTVWYAQELLRIFPYQIYTHPVPELLTGEMVKKAAHVPAQSQ